MRKNFLLLLFCVLSSLPCLAQLFQYTYEGQTIVYEVVDEVAKTCMTKPGEVTDEGILMWNYGIQASLVLPETPKDGDIEYTLIAIGDYGFYMNWNLTSVVIPSSVSEFGVAAFGGCSALKTIDIPSSVTSIGEYAFCECSGLTSLEIPNSVTSIGEYAFYECSGLTSLEIPNSVTSIGEYAFYECSGLTSLEIPNSVTSIGESAFSRCSGLTSLEIPNSVTSIGESAFSRCSGLTSLEIPNSVTSIGESAFSGCSGLTSLEIPNSVTSIGESAFSGCSGLTSVLIGNSVTEVGTSVFSGCNNLKKCAYPTTIQNPFEWNVIAVAYEPEGSVIEDGWVYGPEKSAIYFAPVTMEGEYVTPESVTSIGGRAFQGCSGLTSLEIGNAVTSIGAGAFADCSGLTSLEIGNAVASIGENAFINCKGLTSLVIPNSVSSIGSRAFAWCEELTSVEIGTGVISIVKIPNSVTSIGRQAFMGCSGLTTVLIGKSVTEIGDHPFYDCNNLKKCAYPTTIQNPFEWNVIAVAYEPEDAVIEDGWIYGPDRSAIYFAPISLEGDYVIPESVSTVGEWALAGCSGLTSLEIPNSITSIGKYAFKWCDGVKSLVFNAENCEVGLEAFPTSIESLIIGEQITRIPAFAFSGCSGLTSLEIPNSVASIGERAFDGCSGLTSLEIPNSVASIGERAFDGCSGLTSVVIPSSVSEIGWGVFSGCYGLIRSAYPDNLGDPFENGIAVAYDRDDAVFEDGLIYNGDKSALYFAPLDLKGDYILPETVTSIGPWAFYGCEGLSSVKTLSENPASMPVNAFDGLYESVELTVPEISAYKYLATAWALFKNIQTSTGQELPYFSDGNLEYRLNQAAMTATVTGGGNQSSLNIPASFMADAVKYNVKSIGIEAFKGKKINSIDFDPECEIDAIGDRAFEDSELSDIKLPGSVRTIGNHAFYNTPDLYKVELNEGLTTIGEGAFAATEIRYSKAITIPSTVKAIGADAFLNFECTKVETPDIASWCGIDFGNKYANPIYNTGNLYVSGEQLTDLQVPDGVEAVMPYAFYKCNSIENVTFPEGLKRIGSESFYDCWNISNLTIPGSVVEIGSHVFSNNVVTFSDGPLPIEFQEWAFYYNGGVIHAYWGRPLDGVRFDSWSLNSLEIGNLVTEIPDGGLKDCTVLGYLKLGSGLKTIGNEAFSGCYRLQEVVLPPSVETIGAYAFSGASSLETIIMGPNVKAIGERAFYGTVASTVCITSQNPPVAPNNAFGKYDGRLYVQGEGAAEAYSNAPTCWNRFDSYVMVGPTDMSFYVTEDISGNSGDTFQLSAWLRPANVTLPQIFWRSTNPEVATVDQNGVVTLHADNVKMTTRASELASCRIIAESLYADGPVAEVSLTGEIDGVNEIFTESFGNAIDYTQPYEVYNLNGVKVGDSKDDLAKGIYILRQRSAAVKICVKD